MRKRAQLAFAVFCASVAVLFTCQLWFLRPSEPVYQEKRLRVWLRQYMDNPGDVRAREAVRHIGTNAIPTLLALLRSDDSPRKARLFRAWDRYLGRIKGLPDWMRYPPGYWDQAFFRYKDAVCGFAILGADAQTAVPELAGMYEQNLSELCRYEIGRALIAVGPAAGAAVPSLLRAARHPDPRVRLYAIRTLPSIGAEPGTLAPVLAVSLADSNVMVRRCAAWGLGQLGTNAGAVAPCLVQSLDDSDEAVRHFAAEALKQMNDGIP